MQMPIRMAALNHSTIGATKSRKAIPKDVRAEYKRLYCQSAFKFDPVSASNFDPFERRGLAVALASSELDGVAETWRARAA